MVLIWWTSCRSSDDDDDKKMDDVRQTYPDDLEFHEGEETNTITGGGRNQTNLVDELIETTQEIAALHESSDETESTSMSSSDDTAEFGT